MAGEAPVPLDIFFFPFMAQGHLIPMVDLARLLASRGVRATILTTPATVPSLQPAVDGAAGRGVPLRLLLLPSPPSSATDPPEGADNPTSVPADDKVKFFSTAGVALREPLRRLLREQQPPACLVFDCLFPWAVEVAREVHVPALAFHGTSYFAMCVYGVVRSHVTPPGAPKLPAGVESVVVPGLPHRVEFLRTQLADLSNPDVAAIVDNIVASEERSEGVLMNSFYELERDYVEYHRDVLGRNAWHVGPLSLFLSGDDTSDKDRRGNTVPDDSSAAAFLSWLDGREPRSVVYVCFGSMGQLAGAQRREIAAALEATGRPFVWVVGSSAAHDGALESLLPEGSTKERKGLLITGWAPQAVMLDHAAVGAFVTHCGWNSCLEAVVAGVPMVTWPLEAEQFFNEKLVTEVLGVGVAVGNRVWAVKEEERQLITGEEIRRAVERVMGGGEEAAGVRRKAAELAAMARRATQEGGSSFADVDRLIGELSVRVHGNSAFDPESDH